MKKVVLTLLILTCQLSAYSQTLEDIIEPVADKQRLTPPAIVHFEYTERWKTL